jgi:hypothetical protein
MNKTPASAGLQWLKEGLRLFFRQPGGLLAILFTTMLAGVLLAAIPLVGPILLPSMIITIMQACLAADQGQRITPRLLLTGFRGPEFKILCKLGLVYMAVSLLLSGVAMLVIDEGFWKLIGPGGVVDPKAASLVEPGDIQAALLIGFVQLAIWLGMTYSAPLVYWQKMSAFKAIFFSVAAVWRDLRAFILMILAWFIAFFALSVVSTLIAGNSNIGRTIMMWVGSLCVVILWCTLYVGYRHIFGAPAAPPTHIDTSA